MIVTIEHPRVGPIADALYELAVALMNDGFEESAEKVAVALLPHWVADLDNGGGDGGEAALDRLRTVADQLCAADEYERLSKDADPKMVRSSGYWPAFVASTRQDVAGFAATRMEQHANEARSLCRALAIEEVELP